MKSEKSKKISVNQIIAMTCFVAVFNMIIFSGCSSIDDERQLNNSNRFISQYDISYGQDAPIRIGGSGTMYASFYSVHTFEMAYEEADLVADIVITEWLGELDDSHIDRYEEMAIEETTYFKVKILKEYKNNTREELDEFILIQSGNSEFTYFQYPLFKVGDRFLLCLSTFDDEIFTSSYENCFVIVASQLTELQFAEDSDEIYLLKRNRHENFTDLNQFEEKDSNIYSRTVDSAYRNDEILSEAEVVFQSVYLLDDIEQYIFEKIMEKQGEN